MSIKKRNTGIYFIHLLGSMISIGDSLNNKMKQKLSPVPGSGNNTSINIK
jgi:hypothetical protein